LRTQFSEIAGFNNGNNSDRASYQSKTELVVQCLIIAIADCVRVYQHPEKATP
jgi:hypothetical protein